MLISTPGSRFPRATLQLPRKKKPLPVGSSAGTGTAHCSSHQKALLLFPQDKGGADSMTSREENWFVFSRRRLPSAPINHHKRRKRLFDIIKQQINRVKLKRTTLSK